MNNLKMSVALRGSKVRGIVEAIGEIFKLDGQIEEARAKACLDAEAEETLKRELSAQDDKLAEAVAVYAKGADHCGDPTEDPDYQKFVQEMAVKCRCTPLSSRPCDGLLAGGLCDDLHMDDSHEGDDFDYRPGAYAEDYE